MKVRFVKTIVSFNNNANNLIVQFISKMKLFWGSIRPMKVRLIVRLMITNFIPLDNPSLKQILLLL